MQFGMQYSSEPSTIENARAAEAALRLLDGNIHHGIKSTYKNGEFAYYAYAVFICDENAPVMDGCKRVFIPGNLGSIVNRASAKIAEIAA